MPTIPRFPTSPTFFFKKLDRFQMAEMVDDKLPISLRNQSGLIDRVHARYPIIEKQFVVAIIKAAFEVIRERLILGEVIDLPGIVNAMWLYFNRSKGNSVRARIKTHTPEEIEKS
jgi:nucleoid DNA-binding protein